MVCKQTGKILKENSALETAYFDSDRLVSPMINYPICAQISSLPDRSEIVLRQINLRHTKSFLIKSKEFRFISFVGHSEDQNGTLFDLMQSEIIALVQNLTTKTFNLILIALDPYKEKRESDDILVK